MLNSNRSALLEQGLPKKVGQGCCQVYSLASAAQHSLHCTARAKCHHHSAMQAKLPYRNRDMLADLTAHFDALTVTLDKTGPEAHTPDEVRIS